jgi:hypothetical protein
MHATKKAAALVLIRQTTFEIAEWKYPGENL